LSIGSTILPFFLKGRGERISERIGAKIRATLRLKPYGPEIRAVILLGVFDYVPFWPGCGAKSRVLLELLAASVVYFSVFIFKESFYE